MKIETRNLVYEYSSTSRAIDSVNLSIEGNEPVAIIGQNGAGKTTLVKHFNGILRPTSGTVLVNNTDINRRDTADWAATVGYVFQNSDDQLFLESVRKEFVFGPEQIGMEQSYIDNRIDNIANLVGLSGKLDTHPFDLSPTEKKFCAIGSVLMMNPEIVIFDEPTCGQDKIGNERLRHIIRAMIDDDKLCITVSHDMKFVAENFSRVIVMCSGKILLDEKTTKVFSRPDILQRTYVAPPPITRVAQGAGFKETVVTMPAFISAFNKERSQNG